MNIGAIVEGHVNEMLGLNKNLAEARIEICKKCPIYSTKLGGICNSTLYLNPDTGDISLTKKKGYVRGCSCRIQAKATILNEHCSANKW
jgi:hypothetical protein